MTERASIETAAQILEQSYTLLSAEMAALDATLEELGQWPSQLAPNSDRAAVYAARVQVRKAILQNRAAYNRLMSKIDPFGDLYLVQPGAPVTLTRYGIVPSLTGFCHYADPTTVQAIAADTPTVLTFALDTINTTQKPADAGTWFDGSRVFGEQGDAFQLRVQLTVTPTSDTNTATQIELGYAVDGVLTNRLFVDANFLSGYDVAVVVSFDTTLYASNAWAADGAQIVVLTDGPVEVTSREVFIARLHKGTT